MRISILQDYLRSGGTERQAVSLCNEFQKAGARAVLTTIRPGGSLLPMVESLGIDYRPLRARDLKIDFLAPGLTSALRQQQPDVVLCMGEVANTYARFLQGRLRRTSIVGTLRLGKRLPQLNLQSFRRLPATIANTVWWKRKLVELGLDESRVHVVPNGLTRRWDLSMRNENRLRIRSDLKVLDSEVVLLNVAGFRSGKRQDELIRMVASLPTVLGWRLWLVGDGPNLDECRRLVSSLRLQDRVHFAGHVDDPYVFYSGADIAVSASARDALPNFLVEAQSLSLPVIASDFRGVSEALENGLTGFVVAINDADQYRERLVTLITKTDVREGMGRAAGRRAHALHDPDRQAGKYLDIFSSIRS